jgi:cytochrome P450 family 138
MPGAAGPAVTLDIHREYTLRTDTPKTMPLDMTTMPGLDRTEPLLTLPPGPPLPRVLQGIAALAGRRAGLQGMQKRYGPDFTLDVPVFGQLVVISDPDHVKQMFKSPPAELDTIDGSLGRVMGPNSLFVLKADRHRAQRKLLVPPFHGRRLQSFEAVIGEETVREFATWQEGREFPTLPSMMRITLNAILRAVFGVEGAQFDRLQQMLPKAVALGSMLAIVPIPQWDWGQWSPWGRFFEARRQYDLIVDELIAAARADPNLADRRDVLAVMLQSRYDDGSEMNRDEISDQLVTLLTAGYETTATTLAWAVERLRRHPELLSRLVDEIDAGGDELLDATILEVQRSRPVIDTTFRSVVAPSYQLGPWLLPQGQAVLIAIGLMHDNDALFADHLRFNPDRFVGARPDNNEWIPYGGGARRCIGAAFASMELKVVLRAMLHEFTLVPTTDRDERWRSRGVALAPAKGGRVVVTRRP